MPQLITVVVPSSPARVCAQPPIGALPQLGCINGWWYADRGDNEANAVDGDATAGVMVCTQSLVSELFPNSGINDVAEAGKGEVDL